MTEIRPHINAASPTPRPRGGVVGFVAELEQLDAPTTAAPAAPAPGPVSDPEAAAAAPAVPSADGDRAADRNGTVDPNGAVDRDGAVDGDGFGAVGGTADGDDGAASGQSVLDGPVVWSPIVWSAAVQNAALEASLAAPDPLPDVPPVAVEYFTPAVDLEPVEGAAPPAAFPAGDTVEFVFPEHTPRPVPTSAPTRAETRSASGDLQRSAAADRAARRLRLALLAGLAAAVLVGVGVAWAALDGPRGGGAASAEPPVVEPGAIPPFSTGARPGLDPVRGSSASPSVTPSASGSTPAQTPGATAPGGNGGADGGREGRGDGRGDGRADGGNGGGSLPGAPQPGPGGGGGDGTPSDPGKPWPTDPTMPPEQEPTQAPAAPLTATFTRSANTVPLGLTGYRGTVRIANPGGQAVQGWTVTIVLPGENPVTRVQGAAVQQSGSTVVFTPADGTGLVPAQGEVTFSFRVDGVLAGEPTACEIDGRPCS